MINSVDAFYAHWGIRGKPFMTADAESEKTTLTKFFLEPAWLDEVKARSATVALFGPRGMGKTAIRLYVEQTMADSGLILVPYVNFDHMTDGALANDPHLSHLNQIIRVMLVFGLLHYCKVKPREGAVETLGRQVTDLLHRYFDSQDDLADVLHLNRDFAVDGSIADVKEAFSKALRQTFPWYTFRPLRRFARNQWGNATHFLRETAYVVRGVKPELSSGEERERRRKKVRADFRRLAALAPKFGGDSWWILVDRLDESCQRVRGEEGKSRADVKDLTTRLTTPLMADTRLLLETPSVYFKFFLWSHLREPLREIDIRLDKLRDWNIQWSANELGEMIDRRLKHFSDGRVPALAQICVQSDAKRVRQIVTKLAGGSPRHLVQLMDATISEHVSYCRDRAVDASRLTVESAVQGLDECCNRLALDAFGDETLKRIVILGQRFTAADVSRKLSLQDAASCLNELEAMGAIQGTGVGEGAERVFEVRDPLLMWKIDRNLIMEP